MEIKCIQRVTDTGYLTILVKRDKMLYCCLITLQCYQVILDHGPCR